MDGEERERSVKLFCPSASKIIQIMAWEEQKLDLGSVARAFGLDPNTLKLNGHFISRGVDLVASSVTWKSLIGFFSARGLSTGANDSDALVVDGKPSKVGSKRSHEVEGDGNGILNTRDSKRPQLDYGSNGLLGRVDVLNGTNEANGFCGLGLKRKLWSEDESCLKRSKKSDGVVSGLRDRQGSSSSPTGSRWSCSFLGKNTKRMRGEEIVAASPLKKTR